MAGVNSYHPRGLPGFIRANLHSILPFIIAVSDAQFGGLCYIPYYFKLNAEEPCSVYFSPLLVQCDRGW